MDPAQQIQPGDFLLTTIDGFWANLGVRLGQAACGDWSRYSHAALYVGGPDRLAIEMAPGGLMVREFSDFAGRPLAISDWPLDISEREDIVGWAWDSYSGRNGRQYYGWLNYPLIGLARLTGGRLPKWAKRYLAAPDFQECSQWIDSAYLAAGVHLFSDDRLPGLVTPGDLTYVLSRPKGTES